MNAPTADPDVFAAIATQAPQCDVTSAFPQAAFDALHRAGHIAAPPIKPIEIKELLHLLTAVGRADLSTGRIFEGHVNALQLISQYGNGEQVRTLNRVAGEGGLFGVWNTDLPDDPLRIEGGRFRGRKSFASGVDGLSHAIVTVSENGARHMLVVPLKGLSVDRTWWRPLGMRASGSHIVDFTGAVIQAEWKLGEADAYIREPWFSAGAIRFAAVQLGGMQAVYDVALAHLRSTGRAEDPYQRHRLGRMTLSVETARLWIERAGMAWRAMAADPNGEGARTIAIANATRLAVELQALDLLEETERGIGFAGVMAPHPLERLMRDLRTYLRQPNPDGALAAVGSAVSKGVWSPDREGP